MAAQEPVDLVLGGDDLRAGGEVEMRLAAVVRPDAVAGARRVMGCAGGEAGHPGGSLRGLVLGPAAAGREQLVAGQPAVEGRPASPETEFGQFSEQGAGSQVRVLSEPLAAVVSEGAGEQVRAGGPAARGPLAAQVGADGDLAVARLPGDLAGRQPVPVQKEDLFHVVWGQHLVTW